MVPAPSGFDVVMDSSRATWEKYMILSEVVASMDVRDRRVVFQMLRGTDPDPNMFFPEMGFSLAEFCVFYVLSSDRRTRTSVSNAPRLRGKGGGG